jgi:AcrR family transcriptional regulator
LARRLGGPAIDTRHNVLAKTTRTLKKGELTRQDLLAAGRSVFARVGYQAAETVQIAREAGKSIGVFYIYFQNKDDLLASLVEEFSAEMQGTVAGPLNPPEEVVSILSTLWTIYKKHAPTFLALTEAAVTVPSFAAISRTLRDFAKDDFSSMIRERQRQGFCRGVDADFAGAALETMVHYCLYEWLARGMGDFADEAEERLALETLVGVMRSVLQLS